MGRVKESVGEMIRLGSERERDGEMERERHGKNDRERKKE